MRPLTSQWKTGLPLLLCLIGCQRITDFEKFALDTASDDTSSANCSGIACYEPPGNQCTENGDLRVFSARGYCIGGQCKYAATDEPCETGDCALGICENNPCQGVTCDKPPPPSCEEKILNVYSPAGFCSESEGKPLCSYSKSQLTCAAGCENGQCQGDPCAVVICDKPPAAYCEGNKQVLFETIGKCVSSGVCKYNSREIPCTEGCDQGRCKEEDACLGVVCNRPRARYCVNDNTLRVFSSPGFCESGACLYPGSYLTCSFGCKDGACTSEPCKGVSCQQPPSPTCVDSSTLRIWDGEEGECSAGYCSYGVNLRQCATACVEGNCEADICGDVLCTNPPASYCDGNIFNTFKPVGVCVEDGWCSYEKVAVTCEFGCDIRGCLTEDDRDRPIPGDDGDLVTRAVTFDSLTLTWAKAVDNSTPQEKLVYKAVGSANPDIDTVQGADSATIVQDWTADITSVDIFNLGSDQTFYLNVLVRDLAGNMAVYKMVQAKTLGVADGFVAFFPFSGDYQDKGPHKIPIYQSTPSPPSLDTNRDGVMNGSYYFTDFNVEYFYNYDHPSPLGLENELTVSVWVNLVDAEADQKIVGRVANQVPVGYQGWALGVSSEGRLYPEVWDSTRTRYSSTAGSIPSGTWTHLAFTWKTGGKLRGYIDGTRVLDINAGPNPIGNPGGGRFRIGTRSWMTPSFSVNGNIDDIRIYDRELDQSQIKILKNLPAD